MPANANAAINTYFQLPTTASPEVFATVANVGDQTGLTLAATVVDVTSHSNADAFRRKIVTLLDPGKLSFPLFFIMNDPGHIRLLACFMNRGLPEAPNQPFDCQLSYPTVPTRTVVGFQAQMDGFSMKSPVAGVIEATVSLIVIGVPRFPGVNA